MTKEEIRIPKHLDIKIWKAALYIENAATKEEASNRPSNGTKITTNMIL